MRNVLAGPTFVAAKTTALRRRLETLFQLLIAG
jgi:hypothetical protein